MHLFRSLFFFILTTNLYGQSEFFTPYQMEPPQLVSLDTMGTYDEGLVDSTGHLKLYRKELEVWLIEDAERGALGWRMREMDNILKLEYHDFNGGRPELILTWQSISGHSGIHGGVAEQYEEVVIYDLQNALILLHIDRMMFVETWWIQYLEDLDSVDMDTISPTYSGSEQYCEEYSVSLSDSIIHVEPVYDNHCGATEFEEELESYTLVWRERAFFTRD